VVLTYHPSDSRKHKIIGGSWFWMAWAKKGDLLYSKITREKRVESVA
jgi:hypothetical protein